MSVCTYIKIKIFSLLCMERGCSMNILLLGNGFDLAHGLPTKYADFLEWVKEEYNLYTELSDQKKEIVGKLDPVRVEWAILLYPSKMQGKVTILAEEAKQIEIWQSIGNNIWIDYFLNNPMYQKENWIDFESEISKVIQSIDKDFEGKGLGEEIEHLSNSYLESHFLYIGFDSLFEDNNGHRGEKEKITYSELEKRLEDDLNRLIRALEIYLTEYVEKIDCKVFSPDIEEIAIQINEKSHSVLCPKILCFNYTNIFKKVYEKIYGQDYNYIHGKADTENTLETNNMVLGIDEYLPIERRNKDVEFIVFKKFYQRIYKQTGCEYKEWIDKIKKRNFECTKNRKNNAEIHNLYIFGHSLDVTDGDILRDLILTENVHTTIFYLNKKVLGQQIANLVKVLGQDELIKRTGGSTKTIEFKQQRNMEKR